jgi:hypothetical protein
MPEPAHSEIAQEDIIGQGDENRITETIAYNSQAYIKRMKFFAKHPKNNLPWGM